LRDQVIPQFSAELDQFSQGLAGRFAAQGLNLFTDGLGNVPVSAGVPTQTGYIGFSSEIQVNPAILATPSLVRDGTEVIAGSPTGASAYTPNPQNLSGFTGMITRILDYALTNSVQSGVTQPAIVTTGLGPGGNLSASFSGATDISDFATALTVAQSSTIGQANAASSEAQAVQTSLTTSLTAATGVSVDSQLSQLVALQNAYGANAKVISTVQEMMGVVISMVQT